MPRKTGLAATLAAGLLAAGCSVFGGAAAPEPSYTVVRAEPPFEIRDYPALTVVQTTVERGYDGAINQGFGRLFDYISGANSGSREIAMTAPVLTEPETAGETIAMTAPVLTEESGAAWTTSFVLPEGMDLETAPQPTDPAVRLARIPPRRLAVVRFSGFFSEGNIAENRQRLAGWLAEQGAQVAGDWQAAGYNPPWTLPWGRRNEVLVPIAQP
ncbi:MAG: heme-binding protein [Paracoccaceae bacterium]